MLSAIARNPAVFKLADETFLEDSEFTVEAVRRNARALGYAPHAFVTPCPATHQSTLRAGEYVALRNLST